MDLIYFLTSWLFTLYLDTYIIYILYPILLFLVSEDLINVWVTFFIIVLIYIFVVLYKKIIFVF
jgi:hypothetical protein